MGGSFDTSAIVPSSCGQDVLMEWVVVRSPSIIVMIVLIILSVIVIDIWTDVWIIGVLHCMLGLLVVELAC